MAIEPETQGFEETADGYDLLFADLVGPRSQGT